jgi:hypothetical protein
MQQSQCLFIQSDTALKVAMIAELAKSIFDTHGIDSATIQHIKSSGDGHLFFVGYDYVLRITDGNIDRMMARSQWVQALQSVQKILFSGCSFSGSKYSDILCSRISGCDYIDAVRTLWFILYCKT